MGHCTDHAEVIEKFDLIISLLSEIRDGRVFERPVEKELCGTCDGLGDIYDEVTLQVKDCPECGANKHILSGIIQRCHKCNSKGYICDTGYYLKSNCKVCGDEIFCVEKIPDHIVDSNKKVSEEPEEKTCEHKWLDMTAIVGSKDKTMKCQYCDLIDITPFTCVWSSGHGTGYWHTECGARFKCHTTGYCDDCGGKVIIKKDP